jgi:hypothetical protein
MAHDPILLIGGSGIVGRWTARMLRAAHPAATLLIGGRNTARAEEIAAEVGDAQGVAVDFAADDLGLGEQPVSAVATLFMDSSIAGLRFAQARGVPHVSISPGMHEIGPEVAAYMRRPHIAPVVLGTEWLVGATTIPTLEVAKRFADVDSISIGALLDEQDEGGPAAAADYERQTKTMPAALARLDGAYVWRNGVESEFRAADGTQMTGSGLAPHDVVALAAETGAPNVEFLVAVGVTSTRRRGEPMSTEIVVDVAGRDHAGRPLHTRHAVVHPEGQMPLTGLGVALVLERLVGLDGSPATPPGLYFPYQVIEPATYLARLEAIGGRILDLEPL